jgi:hypothetical protein
MVTHIGKRFCAVKSFARRNFHHIQKSKFLSDLIGKQVKIPEGVMTSTASRDLGSREVPVLKYQASSVKSGNIVATRAICPGRNSDRPKREVNSGGDASTNL